MICTQGRVIPDLIAWWCERDGVRPDKSRNHKGSTWVMSCLPSTTLRMLARPVEHASQSAGRWTSECRLSFCVSVNQGLRCYVLALTLTNQGCSSVTPRRAKPSVQ